jgi:hypothetical protein
MDNKYLLSASYIWVAHVWDDDMTSLAVTTSKEN